MARPAGISNWKLTVRRENDHVFILRATTCDTSAVLPDTLFGLPVTALSDRALSPAASETDGEELLLSSGRAGDSWDNGKLRELTVPPTVTEIGSYAFYNCRSLRTLHLSDSICRLGAEAFMNCRAFHTLELKQKKDAGSTILSDIVSSLPQELDVKVSEEGAESYRLLFPEYYELHTENSPAHHFDYTIEGSGYPYHHVFRSKVLHLTDYDGLWPDLLKGEYDTETAMRLSWYRLRYPKDLTEGAKEAYTAFVGEHMASALALCLAQEDLDGLQQLLSMPSLPAEDLSSALEVSRKKGFTAATALLLEKEHRMLSVRRRRDYSL